MADAAAPGHKLTYTDSTHRYYLNGKQATGVTTVAKIPPNSYNLEKYGLRQVAIGLTLDRNIIENIAVDLENKDAINGYCDDAKRVARAHAKADRGTQMHRVLEYILLDQEDKLLTAQQHRDAVTLKRTLDRYKVTPHDGLIEQFAIWPHYKVAGRFDAVLQRADGRLILVDLKSGPNAILYPQGTSVQLALYARAPHVSIGAGRHGDKQTLTEWRTMPEGLNRDHAWVMLVEPDTDVGTMYEIDIRHGWAAASKALEILNWRKALDNGKAIARQVPDPDDVNHAPPSVGLSSEVLADPLNKYVNGVGQTLAEQIASHTTLSQLRAVWAAADAQGLLTTDVSAALKDRAAAIEKGAA
jgi:hypothetical protein